MRHARIRPAPGRSSRLAVEARLREHEHRDRRDELQPLGRALAPEQAPEDVAVAGDELTDDEREVDPEREPGDVEDDERRDATARARRRTGSARAKGGRGARRGRHDPFPTAAGAGREVSAGGATLPDIPWMLRAAPRRPTRRAARPGARARRARRGPRPERGARAARSTTPRSARRRRSSEVRVVEVDVDEVGQHAAHGGRERDRRASASSGRAPSVRPDGSSSTEGAASEAQRSPGGRYGGRSAARRAVDVPELRTRLRDVDVGVPAASAEERRREAELAKPRALGERPARRCAPLEGRAWSGAVQCVW